MSDHIDYVCPGNHDRSCLFCDFCDGGLFACDVCGAFEGATPDDCPGERMTSGQSDAVYAGALNYRDGAWRDECCEVMRPIYGLDGYMAEHGYMKDESGKRWVKTTAPEAQSGWSG